MTSIMCVSKAFNALIDAPIKVPCGVRDGEDDKRFCAVCRPCHPQLAALMSPCDIDKITRMAITIKGSKSNKHNIIGVCLSGLQSVVEQVQRLAPPGHFAKTINISEYPEYSGEMIVLDGLSEFFAGTDGIAQINSKELEVVDPKTLEDEIASDFEMVETPEEGEDWEIV